jgi:hypothetical protein
MHWIQVDLPDSSVGNGSRRGEDLMYSYAVQLSTDSEHWTEGISWYVIRAALLYNIAFIHHWRATTHGLSSTLSLALHLYEQA